MSVGLLLITYSTVHDVQRESSAIRVHARKCLSIEIIEKVNERPTKEGSYVRSEQKVRICVG